MRIDNPAAEKIPQMRVLWKEAFGDSDDFLDHFFATAFSPKRSLCLWEGEALGAALYWFDCAAYGQKYAYIYAVATGKAFRGRGFCRALMASAKSRLEEQGYHGVILVPADEGLRQMYGTMGYVPMSGKVCQDCEAQGDAVYIKEIGAEEFAAARREYLDDAGVRQEGESLAFLSGIARFYRGADFLLTARIEADHVEGVELLGNREILGGIVKALGCRRGSFWLSGDAPFAMFLPLNGGRRPKYFGFAFD